MSCLVSKNLFVVKMSNYINVAQNLATQITSLVAAIKSSSVQVLGHTGHNMRWAIVFIATALTIWAKTIQKFPLEQIVLTQANLTWQFVSTRKTFRMWDKSRWYYFALKVAHRLAQPSIAI